MDCASPVALQLARLRVTVTNTYDNLGRLRTRTYPDAGVEAFGYAANVAPTTSYTNQLSKVWTYAYDGAARKTNEVGVGVYTNSFTYNAASDLKRHERVRTS